MQVVVNDIPRTKGNVIVKVNGVSRECKKVQLNDGTVIWEVENGPITKTIHVQIPYYLEKKSGETIAKLNNDRAYLTDPLMTTFKYQLTSEEIPVNAYVTDYSIVFDLDDSNILAFYPFTIGNYVELRVVKSKTPIDASRGLYKDEEVGAWFTSVDISSELPDLTNWQVEKVPEAVPKSQFTQYEYKETELIGLCDFWLTVTYKLE